MSLTPGRRVTTDRLQDLGAVIVGLLAAGLLIVAVQGGGKLLIVTAAGILGVCGLVMLAYVPGLPERVLLFGMALTLSVSIKFHPLFRSDHLGGAVGLRISLTELVVGALLLLALGPALRRGWARIRLNGPVGIFAIAYLVAAVVSTLGSGDRVLGWFQVSAVAQAFALAIVLGSWGWDVKTRRWFVGGLLAALLMQSGIAITQSLRPGLVKLSFLGATDYTEDAAPKGRKLGQDVGQTSVGGEAAYRPTGMLIHPNVLAGYFVLTLPLAAALALGAEARWQRRLAALAAAATAAALYLSLSRSGWIGTAVAITFGALLAWRWRVFNLSAQARVVLVAVALVVAAALAWKADRIYLRFTETASDAMRFRREYALAAWRMALDDPFAGVGLNTFTDHVVRYDASGTSRIKAFPVHNAFLLELAETGFPGGLAFALMVGAMVLTTMRAAREASGEARIIALAIAAGLVGFWSTQISDYFYRVPIMTSLVWAHAGLASGLAASKGEPA